jgi:hypothetical protein
MSSTEVDELLEYLDRLVAATKRGDIEWRRVNPTTYSWETGPQQFARVTLQRVGPGAQTTDAGRVVVVARTTYLLQAADARSNVVRLSVNGAQDAASNVKLEELYNAIGAGFSRKGLDFLKAILPPDTPES